MKVFAKLEKYTLRDFATDALFAGAVRCLFGDAELYVHYAYKLPSYKTDIAGCLWSANTILLAGTAPNFPVEAAKIPNNTPILLGHDAANAEALDADLVLTWDMLQHEALNTLSLPTLRIPEDRIEAPDQALIDIGLDPTRWIANAAN